MLALTIDEWDLIQKHSLSTIASILSGYFCAVLFALAVSALMIRFPLFERLIMPIFVGMQSVPKIAIAPLILVVLLSLGLRADPASAAPANTAPALAITAATASTAAPSCAPISRSEVEGLFDHWNAELASGDAARVAALYSDDALLLPTLSNQPRDTPAAIRDYFEGFLARA